MKQEIDKELRKLSENDAIVGQFTSYIFKNNASYLVNYLNTLIHGINKGIKAILGEYSISSDDYIP
jgi:hypothetical protein